MRIIVQGLFDGRWLWLQNLHPDSTAKDLKNALMVYKAEYPVNKIRIEVTLK